MVVSLPSGSEAYSDTQEDIPALDYPKLNEVPGKTAS
jgi:hypothetical protein